MIAKGSRFHAANFSLRTNAKLSVKPHQTSSFGALNDDRLLKSPQMSVSNSGSTECRIAVISLSCCTSIPELAVIASKKLAPRGMPKTGQVIVDDTHVSIVQRVRCRVKPEQARVWRMQLHLARFELRRECKSLCVVLAFVVDRVEVGEPGS